MNRQTDQQLLRHYAERQSEPAFSELVRRHVDLVYSAALRMVCDTHLAEDVTQSVFVALAKSAPRLTDRPVLSGWLHQTAQNLAANVVRSEVRRRNREQEAVTMNELLSAESESEISWEAIAPHLDAALGELGDADRDALMLRYFEKKSAAEMAGVLGISDEAAQKRVNRAVERLREFFSKHKVATGTGGLVVLISANAVQSAPVGLAVSISAAVIAGTTAVNMVATTASKAMAVTALQKLIIITAVVAGIMAPVLVLHLDQTKAAQQAAALQRQAARLAELEKENDRFSSLLARESLSQPLPDAERMKLLQLRGQVARLKMDVNELSRAQTQAAGGNGGSNTLSSLSQVWADRANQLKRWLEQNPGAKIPELRFLDDQDWINAIDPHTLNDEEDRRQAMSNVRANAQLRVLDIMGGALRQYAAANGGQFPHDLSQLSPYFRSPIEDAILEQYEIVPSSSLVSQLQQGDDSVITEKAPVDETWDSRTTMGLTHGGMADCRVTNRWEQIQ